MQKICRCVRAIAKLAELFEKRLQEIEADALYNEIELPLANVLAQMQAEGITIDTKQLQEAGDELDEQIAQLEKKSEYWAVKMNLLMSTHRNSFLCYYLKSWDSCKKRRPRRDILRILKYWNPCCISIRLSKNY